MRASTLHWAKRLVLCLSLIVLLASWHIRACLLRFQAASSVEEACRLAIEPEDVAVQGGLVIATKVAGPGSMPWLRGGPEALDASAIAEAIDASLSRLRCDYIDLYQLHWPDRYSSMASLSSKNCSCFHSSSLLRQHTPRATCSANVIDLAEA